MLHFFDAGTSNTRTVYSNYGLSTSLGVTVTCDAGGYPTSNGSSKVEIYTGNTAYRVKLLDSSSNTIWDIDNIVGALNTSSFLTDASLVPVNPITNTATNQTIEADDDGKFYNVDCSGGDVTVTFDNAADLGNGHTNIIRHDGTANQVLIVGSSSELFKIAGHAGVTAFALTSRGRTVRVTCDATGFKVEETVAALFNTTGIILIADRTNTPPAAEAGQRYILTSSPVGAWSSFAEHDIVEANGQSGWFKVTPPSDCGWLAYVQDEDETYQFIGSAWVQLLTRPADQTAMEAATSLLKVVVPGVQHYHPGHPKARVNFNGTGTIAIRDDYGVASLTDNGAGIYAVNYDTAFSSANYTPLVCGGGNDTVFTTLGSGGPLAAITSIQCMSRGDSGGNTDLGYVMCAAIGDH